MQNKWLELPLLGFMIVSSMYTIHVRMKLKKADGNPFGLGHRVISLVALFILIPAIMIMALENVLSKDAVAPLLGTIVGYSLSRLAKDGVSSK